MTGGRVIRRERTDGTVYWWTGQVWCDDPDAAKRYPRPQVAERSADIFKDRYRGERVQAVSETVRL